MMWTACMYIHVYAYSLLYMHSVCCIQRKYTLHHVTSGISNTCENREKNNKNMQKTHRPVISPMTLCIIMISFHVSFTCLRAVDSVAVLWYVDHSYSVNVHVHTCIHTCMGDVYTMHVYHIHCIMYNVH